MGALLVEEFEPVTYAGNEITDALRLAQGPVDGFLAGQGAGVGVFPAVTNRCPNTTFASTTGWAGGKATISPDATRSDMPFPGHNWMKIVQTAANGSLLLGSTAYYPAAANSQSWAVSCWGVFPAGVTVRLYVQSFDASLALLTSYFKDFVGTGVPQRISNQITITDATAASVRFLVQVRDVGTDTYWVGAPQLAQQATNGELIDLPYVANTATGVGSSATRGAGRMQFRSSILDPTTGWAAALIRPAVAATTLQNNRYWLNWGGAATSGQGLGAFLNRNTPGWVYVYNYDGTTFTYKPISTVNGWAQWQPIFQLVAWDSTKIYNSLNGAALQSATPTTRDLPTNTTFDLGGFNGNGGSVLAGNVIWFACGSGVPTNAEVNSLYQNIIDDPLPRHLVDIGFAPV